MLNKMLRYRHTDAIALMALLLAITVLAAPKLTHRDAMLTGTTGGDFLSLNPDME